MLELSGRPRYLPSAKFAELEGQLHLPSVEIARRASDRGKRTAVPAILKIGQARLRKRDLESKSSRFRSYLRSSHAKSIIYELAREVQRK